MQGVLTFIFIIAGDIASLIDFASFLIWIFYGIAMVALLVMRKTKKDAERSYKVRISSNFTSVSLTHAKESPSRIKTSLISVLFQVPLVFPVFIIFVSLFLCLVPIITDPSPRYFIALILIALGIAVYIPLVFYKIRPQWMG
jgi:L-type amino acid transporter 9